jgi:hypothetical protein
MSASGYVTEHEIHVTSKAGHDNVLYLYRLKSRHLCHNPGI